MATATVARPTGPRAPSPLPEPAQSEVIPDVRELHRVITTSVRELLETARLEAQAGAMDTAQVERLIFRAAAQRGTVDRGAARRAAAAPAIVRVMLAAFLEEHAR